jgi:hypothetical protein
MRQLFCCTIILALLFTAGNAQTPEQTKPQTIAECLDFVQQYSE